MRGIRACPACIVGLHRSGWIGERNPARWSGMGHPLCPMPYPPDPFWLILGCIAIACLALYPIRRWRQRHHDYGNDDTTD